MSPHIDPVFTMGKDMIFSLPLEIRYQIYCYVFPSAIVYPTTEKHGSRHIHTDSYRGGLFVKSFPLASEVLALLLVNRQILEEAAPIFYRKSHFRGNALEMSRFIKGIGRIRANMLTNLELQNNFNLVSVHNFLKFLLPLEGLKMVRLTFWRHNFDGLKDELVMAGILDFTGKFNIEVYNEWVYKELDTDRPPEQISYLWSCEKGATEWVGPKKTVADYWSTVLHPALKVNLEQ